MHVPSFIDRMLVVQVHLLPSSSTGNSASNILPNLPLVICLPAAPFPTASNEESQDDTGSELKKRKSMMALQNGETTSFAADGGEGNNVIGTNFSMGRDVEMNVISNQLFVDKDVMAGHDDQACLGK